MESTAFHQNIGRLEKIYALYEKALVHTHVACQELCADCCTCNVIITSLEADFMVQSLDSNQLAGVKQRLEEKFPKKRYIPKMTTNQFAGYCMSGQEIPEEENNADWGKCPLLEGDRCTLYPARPFGCRSMMSQVHCRKTGYAQVPPLDLTITHIFLQYIEQLDHQGFSGNLSDMLALSLDIDIDLDLETSGNFEKKQVCIENMKMKVLLVPPEHRLAVGPLLKQLAALT